jgi:hypothetical protein
MYIKSKIYLIALCIVNSSAVTIGESLKTGIDYLLKAPLSGLLTVNNV